jgi:hypothetical protein
MTRLTESSLLNIKNKSFQVTAQLVIPDGRAQGTIVAQGGSFGGWGLMVHQGAARFAYNLLGVQMFITDAERPIPAGEHQVRAEFAYDGGGLAKGGTVTLYYDGEKTGEGKITLTEPMLFTATETAEVGRELGTPIIAGTSPQDTEFTGKIKWVELSTGEDDHTHMLDPDSIMQMLMSKQ